MCHPFQQQLVEVKMMLYHALYLLATAGMYPTKLLLIIGQTY